MIYVEQQNKDLYKRLGGKTLKQRNSFVYLGGAVCRDGDTKTKIAEYNLGIMRGGRWNE